MEENNNKNKKVFNVDMSNKDKKTIEFNIENKEEKNIIPEKPTKNNKLFFGWNNIKWFLREILKVYSSKDSYFSKKRIESSTAFILSQIAMIFYFIENYKILTVSEFLLLVSAEFAIAGYYVTQIQIEKKRNKNKDL